MIDIKNGFDSALELILCDYCGGRVNSEEPKTLCGTGNSVLAVYHPSCFELVLSDFRSAHESAPLE